MTSSAALLALGAAARDLLLAETCAGCGKHSGAGAVCAGCRETLRPQLFTVTPLHADPGFPPTVAATSYAGVVARLVVAHKEHGRLALARPLGRLLAAGVATALDDPTDPVVLVPVPSRRSVTRARGHDPVLRMARAAARTLGGDASVAAVLRQRRRVDDQSSLSLGQRQANLRGALHAVDPPPLAHVVVVDDVCSSGATLTAAVAALVAAGSPAHHIRAVVVASPVVGGCGVPARR